MGIDERIDHIGRHPFQARFRLLGRDRAFVQLRGMSAVRTHHPVFVAQHATATCCRACLERWHQIPKDRDLDPDEQAYAVDVICRWIERELDGDA